MYQVNIYTDYLRNGKNKLYTQHAKNAHIGLDQILERRQKRIAYFQRSIALLLHERGMHGKNQLPGASNEKELRNNNIAYPYVFY